MWVRIEPMKKVARMLRSHGDLRAALEQFQEIYEDLAENKPGFRLRPLPFENQGVQGIELRPHTR